MRAFINKIIAWLESLADEGKHEMTDLVEAGESSALSRVVTQPLPVSTITEDAALGAVEMPGGAPLLVAPTEAAKVLAAVKGVLAVADRKMLAFDESATLAVKTAGSDVEQVLAKTKLLLGFAGNPLDAWDEAVALAKAIVAA